ncbi:MAG: outer membrane lipoprotein carrier protein LolA [Sphingomonadales bacterium]
MKYLSAIGMFVVAAALGLTPAIAVANNEDTTLLEQDNTALEQVRRVEDYLNGMRSLKADFIQRSPDGSVAEGTLALERPGRLRFDYEEDVPLLVVSDGTTLSFIDYDVNQVTRWPIMDTPLGILVAGTIDLRSAMIVNVSEGEDGLLRVSVQDPKRLDEGYIVLILDQNPMTLRAWDAVDPQGQVTRVALVNMEPNVDVDRSRFKFEDPRTMPFSGRRRR